MDADGNAQHPGDMAAQLEMALDNLEAVLAAADIGLANVGAAQRLHHGPRRVPQAVPRALNERFGNADGRFATSLLGVNQLPAQLLVMLEATAVD